MVVAGHAMLGLGGSALASVWFVALVLLWWIPLSWLERPATATAMQQEWLDSLVVVVQIPVYNEDEAALRNCLESVLEQTRPVNRIRVVDDGSIDKATGRPITYDATKAWFLERAADLGVEATWDRTVNRGKRHAQMHVLADDPGDIFVTLDSDSVLDRAAIAEGIKPFVRPTVMSVAGCVVVLNSSRNFLTRMICMLYTPFTRGFRSAQSVLGHVMVNSGTLAFYRADVVRKRAHVYPHERFAGRPMQMNDDSMLTMYAMLDGETVHQPSSLVFTLVPENWHHWRSQSMRWMRGTFVRTLWWLKYMPVRSARFIMPLVEWAQLFLAIVIAVFLVSHLAVAAQLGKVLLPAIAVTLGMNYLIALRYFMVRRDDETTRFQLSVFALAPLAAVWRLLILRPMQLYAMATCWKVQNWGTRDVVEVSASGPGSPSSAADAVPPAPPSEPVPLRATALRIGHRRPYPAAPAVRLAHFAPQPRNWQRAEPSPRHLRRDLGMVDPLAAAWVAQLRDRRRAVGSPR